MGKGRASGFLRPWMDDSWRFGIPDPPPFPVYRQEPQKPRKGASHMLLMHKEKCESQKKRGDGCGLYMATNFFFSALEEKRKDHRPISKSTWELLSPTPDLKNDAKGTPQQLKKEKIDRPKMEGGTPKPPKHKRTEPTRESTADGPSGPPTFRG